MAAGLLTASDCSQAVQQPRHVGDASTPTLWPLCRRSVSSVTPGFIRCLPPSPEAMADVSAESIPAHRGRRPRRQPLKSTKVRKFEGAKVQQWRRRGYGAPSVEPHFKHLRGRSTAIFSCTSRLCFPSGGFAGFGEHARGLGQFRCSDHSLRWCQLHHLPLRITRRSFKGCR